jgi:hypothetical protein
MDNNPETVPAGPDLPEDLRAEMALIESMAQGDPAVALQETQAAEEKSRAVELFEQSKGEYNGLFQTLLNPAFQILAPNWGVKPEEIAALSEAYADVAATYYPDGVGELGPWPGAILCTAMVLGPKMRKPRHADEQEEGTDNGER